MEADRDAKPDTGAGRRGKAQKPREINESPASKSVKPPRGDPLESSGGSAQMRGDPVAIPGTLICKPWNPCWLALETHWRALERPSTGLGDTVEPPWRSLAVTSHVLRECSRTNGNLDTPPWSGDY